MAKMYVKFGTMASGKSLDMIRAIYNYQERGMNVEVFKPATDTRDGSDDCVITSRTGFSVPATWIDSGDKELGAIKEALATTVTIKGGAGNHFKVHLNILNKELLNPEDITHAIFIDEAQFLTKEQVDSLQKICYNYNIPVLAYGLKLDFQSHLFEGSQRLIELADDVQELIGICHCGKRAKQNARVVDGKMVRDGDIVQIGGNESYIALCNECYYKGEIE